MYIHEYQAKSLFAQYDILVPKGYVASSLQELVAYAEKLTTPLKMVKAQIHGGGRGQAGGIKRAHTLKEVQKAGQELFHKTLTTLQAGRKKVSLLYIEEGCDIMQELYFSLMINPQKRCDQILLSTEGGMEIETLAAQRPHMLHSFLIDPLSGLDAATFNNIQKALNFSDKTHNALCVFIKKAYLAFVTLDVEMLEINPLALTDQGAFIALDAKMSFDDNSLYRQEKVRALRDPAEQDPLEYKAQTMGLSYIKLDGTIGCMVNGAGLAMATMDMIRLQGGRPANFLDVGGGASKEKVTQAFQIILSDSNVKGVLVNIFGGIMHCDILAQGILDAAKATDITLPLVVRLEGTCVDKGRALLEQSSLPIIAATDLKDAAQKMRTLV